MDIITLFVSLYNSMDNIYMAPNSQPPPPTHTHTDPEKKKQTSRKFLFFY